MFRNNRQAPSRAGILQPVTVPPARNGSRTVIAVGVPWGATDSHGFQAMRRNSRRRRRGIYFGRTFGSPPGLPGGGMTGIFPPPGGGVTISRSRVCGGQIMPSDRDNFSLRFPPTWPCVSVFERSAGSMSVEHSCWREGVLEGACVGGGRSCALAIATARIEAVSAVMTPAGDSGCLMSHSDASMGNNGWRRRLFHQATA